MTAREAMQPRLQSVDQSAKSQSQSALSQFVMRQMQQQQFDKKLTEAEIAGIPGIRENLGKQPGEPVYQREVFQLMMNRGGQK